MNKILKVVVVVGSFSLLGASCYKAIETNTNESNSNILVNTNSSIDSNINNNLSNIDTSVWQTYTSDQFGFSFQYPNDWVVNVNADSKNLELKPKNLSQTSARFTYVVLITVDDSTYEKYIQRESSETTVPSKEEIIVNGKIGTLETGATINFATNLDFQYRSYILPLKQKTLVLFLTEDTAQYRQILQKITESLDFGD